MRTLILSDMHLGSRGSRAPKLLDGLKRVAQEFDRVILNGDTLDRYPTAGGAENEALIRDVTDACRSRTGPSEILSGNHDPAISTKQWVYLEESRTLVFHGDCITDCTHPTKEHDQILAATMQKKWDELGGRPGQFLDLIDLHRGIQAKVLREFPPIEARSLAEYIVRNIFPPQRPFHILSYCRHQPRRVEGLARTFPQPVAHAVIGHSHRAGRWRVNGMTVYNTGSFMPLSAPYAVVVEKTEVSFQPLAALIRARAITLVPLQQRGLLKNSQRPGSSSR